MLSRIPVLVLAGGLYAACAPAPQTETAQESSVESSAPEQEPWRLEDARPNAADGLRVLVLHDMEGLSGQDDPRSFDFGRPEYPKGQELLAADINAVVAGLFDGGATEVHVVDGHGSGNPEPDLRSDLLDERAQQVFRDESFDTYFDLVEPGAYDAVAVVGMHAKTGSGGFASHTFTIGIEFRVNGQAITETELVGLSWGRAGVPVIFASGDDRLRADLETMPWIEYVTVKNATSASTAELRPVEEARANLRAGARRALERLGEAKVMKVATPIRATLGTVPPASTAMFEGVPGLEVGEGGVSFRTEDLREAYDGLVALVRIATTAYNRVLFETLRARPDGEDILKEFREALDQRWFDVESGRFTPPPRPEPPPGARYHGYR